MPSLAAARRAARRRRVPRSKLRQIERAYAARIKSVIEALEQAIEEELFPQIETITQGARVHVDDAADTIERVFDRIRVRFAQLFREVVVERTAADVALDINSENMEGIRTQMRTVLGVSPLQAEPWLLEQVDMFVKENASLITSLPRERLADIEQMVYREARRGLSPRQMREKILEEFSVTEARAELIARDQVSKFNGRLSELRQRQLGIDEYVWRTSEDGRVRDDHARLNGQRFKWSDPPVTVRSGKRAGERNHPGQDIQCRCYAEPVLESLLPNR